MKYSIKDSVSYNTVRKYWLIDLTDEIREERRKCEVEIGDVLVSIENKQIEKTDLDLVYEKD